MTDDDTQEQEYEITADAIQERQDMAMRQALVSAIDTQLGGGQSKYDTFNWDENPDIEQYYGSYLRNAYARAVCDQPVETTWRDAPDIVDQAEDDENDETTFESEVADLFNTLRVPHYLKRGDTLSGIGEYGIVVLEFDDISEPGEFRTEVGNPQNLTGMRPFSQASIEEINLGGPGSERWGEPLTYTLDLEDEDDRVTQQGTPTDDDDEDFVVHHTRVIHIPSEGLLDDEIRGTPRQEPIWNNLTDIEKALGSAGELAYRASSLGININIDKDYQLEDGGEQQNEHLQRWWYGLEPILRTTGADDVQNLGGETIDPQPVIDANIAAISAQVGIPQSVLKGNETGERATQQDLKEWYGKIQSRREEFVTPVMVRELIDRLLEYGVLPDPRGEDYEVEWAPLAEADQKEVAETEKLRAEMLNTLTVFTDALDEEQIREYLEDGTLPSEIDVSSIEESELEPPEMEFGEDVPPAEAPPEQPGEPPAMADGGEDEQ